MIKKNQGQLSIFLGITLIVVMSLMAFVINVGLFVKAKINLQNATDAAAFSGASTQARQLTNIAYMNWELRNVYKEWMFKYYILGHLQFLNTGKNYTSSKISGSGNVDFFLYNPPGMNFNSASSYGSPTEDPYNLPSICIHNNTSKEICSLYMVPGLPRFPAIGVAGISEIHEALVSKLVTEKGKDCSDRSKINFLAALSWAYGSGIKDIPDAPLVATNRPGAWPKAIELAMRIRNLEMIVNRPPIKDGLNFNTALQIAIEGGDIALNERPHKAYFSAFRNLSGGKFKDMATTQGNSVGDLDELSINFKLYEIPPVPFSAQPDTVSSLLIPPSATYKVASNGGNVLDKHYLDLQVQMANYATMFSTFTNTKYKFEAGVDAEASCGISKTALPVPGYILGFIKNPEVLTYYAVKGESKFIGLFSPFAGTDLQSGITLTSYSAAKPFGGRIGPKLFAYSNSLQAVVPRDVTAGGNRKTLSYISGLVNPAGATFFPGYPIPHNNSFWVTNATQSTIGGVPNAGVQAFFGVPNMIYDFETEGDLDKQNNSVTVLQELKKRTGGTPGSETIGLYDRPQLRALLNSLPALKTGFNSDEVLQAIVKSKRATKYDAINYLVPDFASINNEGKNNAVPFIVPLENIANGNGITYKIFAPLIGPNTLYQNAAAAETVVISFIQTSKPAIEVYLKSVLDVANNILASAGAGGVTTVQESAKTIHVNAGTSNPTPAPLSDSACAVDIASKFNHFFFQSTEACGVVPLSTMMVDYIGKNSVDGRESYYFAEYYKGPDRINPALLMTAYSPQQRMGADGNGQVGHPLNAGSANDAYYSGRNYYSTKFIQLSKVIDQAPTPTGGGPSSSVTDYEAQPLLREHDTEKPTDLSSNVKIRNPLKYDATTGINKPYFLDF